MWYSKHHYAATLARDHTVYFISPPDRWNLRDLIVHRVRTRTSPERVHVLTYTNALPLRMLTPRLRRWMIRQVADRLKHLRGEGRNVIWLFHPSELGLALARAIPGARLIYHAVDPYQSFKQDQECARKADLVIGVNPWFVEQYEPLNPNVLLVPHGVPDKYGLARHKGKKAVEGPYLVLVGGLNARLNYRLLLRLVNELPNGRLVLAGIKPELKGSVGQERAAVLDHPRVSYLGVLDQADMNELISGAVAGIIAYAFEPDDPAPVKPYGSLKPMAYLQHMKPVITTINCYLPGLIGTAVYKVETGDDFIARARMALEARLPFDRSRTEAYLRGHTYSRLVERIWRALR